MIRLQNSALNSVPTAAQSGSNHAKKESAQYNKIDGVKLGQTASNEDPAQVFRDIKKKLQQQGVGETTISQQLRSAMNALPRDSRGVITPELLVDEGRKTSLSQAIERLVLEGLGTGADIAFEHAVSSLFSRYADDLSLDADELEQAKDIMLQEVRDVIADNEVRPWDPNEPAPANLNLDETVEMLQEKVLNRRRLMLEASGDLSRLLSELTVEAQDGDPANLAELGSFLKKFNSAIQARSSHALRKDARSRLLSDRVLEPTQPKDREWGLAFMHKLADTPSS